MLLLEVDGDEGEVLGTVNLGSSEQVELPGLRGRVIDLEDAQAGIPVAVGEGVETCAQDAVLLDASGRCLSEASLGVAASGDEEGTKRGGEGLGEPGPRLAEVVRVDRAEDLDGEGIVEDEGWCIVDLVGCPAQSDAESCPRGPGLVHPSSPSAPSSSRAPDRGRSSSLCDRRWRRENRARGGTRNAGSLRGAVDGWSAR